MKLPITIIILFLLMISCNKIKFIPEISPPLIDKKIHTLKNKANKKIFKFNSEIIFVDVKNKISRFNPEKEIITAIFQLTVNIDQNIFYQNQKMILKQKDEDNFFIFNPQEMNIIKTLANQKIDKIIGIDQDVILYLSGGKIFIQRLLNDEILKIIDLNSQTVCNSEFRDGKVFIFCNHKYFSFQKKKNVLKSNVLPNESTSEFLLSGQNIYYGSTKRELIKYSLTKNKIKWKIKLPMIVKLKPTVMGKYIIVTPEDNNIYFYKKNGTLYWWEKFNSTRLFPPVLMKDNVSVFLMNNEIKFFNLRKKSVYTFKYKPVIDSNPVSIKKYLFLLNYQKDKKKQKISKIGNHYHMEIKIEPKFIKPIGKSIVFRLEPINLIKPDLQMDIFNQSKKSVFSKKMNYNQISSFVWIPKEPGKYKLVLEINSKNKKKMKIEKKFKTVDLEKILVNYIFKLQQECQSYNMD